MKCVAVVLGLLAVLSTEVAAAADATHRGWAISVGGGVADDYSFWTRHYSFGTFTESTEAGWFAAASAQRTIGNSVALRGEVSYLRYTGSFPVAYFDPPAPRGVRIAEIPAIALGVRLQSGGGRGRGTAYLDLLPAVFLAHWTEGVKYGDDWGARDRKSKVAPGIVVGAGMNLPISDRTSLEFGPRYTRSGSLGWTRAESFFTPEESEGLNELGLFAAFTRALN